MSQNTWSDAVFQSCTWTNWKHRNDFQTRDWIRRLAASTKLSQKIIEWSLILMHMILQQKLTGIFRVKLFCHRGTWCVFFPEMQLLNDMDLFLLLPPCHHHLLPHWLIWQSQGVPLLGWWPPSRTFLNRSTGLSILFIFC